MAIPCYLSGMNGYGLPAPLVPLCCQFSYRWSSPSLSTFIHTHLVKAATSAWNTFAYLYRLQLKPEELNYALYIPAPVVVAVIKLQAILCEITETSYILKKYCNDALIATVNKSM